MAEDEQKKHLITIEYSLADNGRVAIEVEAPDLRDQDVLLMILLNIVEEITGVRTKLYLDVVKEARRIAAREQAKARQVVDAPAVEHIDDQPAGPLKVSVAEKGKTADAVPSGEQLGSDDRVGGKRAPRRKRASPRRQVDGDDQP